MPWAASVRKRPALFEALNDHTDYANYYASSVLRRIGAEAKGATLGPAEALKDKNVEGRVQAAVILWKLNKDPAVVPVLVEALHDGKANNYLRLSAAKELWQIDKHPAAVTAVLEILKDENAYVRNWAAEFSWQINRHPAAVPTLVEALKDRDKQVGMGSARILGQIGAEVTVAKAALVEVLQDAEEGVRSRAAQSLKKIDPETAKKAGVK